MSISTSTTGNVVIGTFDSDVQLVGAGSQTIITIDHHGGPQGCDISPFTPLWFNDSATCVMEWHKEATTRRDLHDWLVTYGMTTGSRMVNPGNALEEGMVVIRTTDVAANAAENQSPIIAQCILVKSFTVGTTGIDVYGHVCSVEMRDGVRTLVAYHGNIERYFWVSFEADTLWTMPLLRPVEAPLEVKDDSVALELQAEVDRLREALEQAKVRHHADISVISARLLEEATGRGWCNEYDQIVTALNSSLYVSLDEREADYMFTLTAGDDVNVPVSANGLTAYCAVSWEASISYSRSVVGDPDDMDGDDFDLDEADVHWTDITIGDTEDFSVDDYDALARAVVENVDWSGVSFEVNGWESA